jgi:hypothetical protein
MLRQLTYLIIVLSHLHTVIASPSCSLTCLNQTLTQFKPPPIYINDTVHDALVLFSISCSETTNLTYANVSMSIDHQQTIEVKNPSPLNLIPFDWETQNLTFNLTVQGKFLGYGQLYLRVEYLNSAGSIANFTSDLHVDFAVKRGLTVLDIIFTVVVVILVCIGTFLIGCRLVPQNLYANIRRPVPILIGLFSQFLCLPLVGR